MKVQLPVILNPISRRKDHSVKLSFETRELGDDEILTLLKLEGAEMWLLLAPNEIQQEDIPLEPAELGVKSPSERLKDVLYVWYMQEKERGKECGLFDIWRKTKMEKIIETIKGKLE